MKFSDFIYFFIPILLIAFGLFIKTTDNRYFKKEKKLWKLLLFLGFVFLVIVIFEILIESFK